MKPTNQLMTRRLTNGELNKVGPLVEQALVETEKQLRSKQDRISKSLAASFTKHGFAENRSSDHVESQNKRAHKAVKYNLYFNDKKNYL